MPEQVTKSNDAADKTRRDSRRTTVASFAAIVSVLAASSCCLPVLPFVLAAGFAGSSAFLSAARPYLLAASILFIGYGFYQVRRARTCQRRPRVIASAFLWLSTVFVLISILFPQVMAELSANLLAR
jgi:cytochrome bd-type quinol oxidase subunit 2